MSKEKVFVPHELRTIEVDVEKKIFRVNGEDFGKGCTGFRISCEAPDLFTVRLEIDTTVEFGYFHGVRQVPREEFLPNVWNGLSTDGGENDRDKVL